ncbi:MAG: hypothetical protein JXR10_14750 [Cyclobacteriaceae bacterium]
MKKNLVIGAALGYNSAQLRPFVSTLRATGYTGDIVFFIAHNADEELIDFLYSFDVTPVRIQRFLNWIPKKIQIRRFSKYLRFIHKNYYHFLSWFIKDEKRFIHAVGSTSAWFLSVACSRYFYYYDYLNKHSGEYNYAMLSDVKDVVFQTDPFENIKEQKIYYAVENPAVRIKDQPGNDKWVRTLFGDSVHAELALNKISCSGTTLAYISCMIPYLEEMIKILGLNSYKIPGLFGYDQGAHNYVVWKKLIRDFELIENGEGPVTTMYTSEYHDFIVSEDGLMLNKDGSKVSVIHQYFGHPDLNLKVLRDV